MAKRRYWLTHLITAASNAAGVAPTNALALVESESVEGLSCYRNATGIAGGLFDFGGAALLAIIGSARPLRCVEIGAILGGQSAHTCTRHTDAGTKEATIVTGTTEADWRIDEGGAFIIPANGQIQFTTTGATGALRLWLIVEDVA